MGLCFGKPRAGELLDPACGSVCNEKLTRAEEPPACPTSLPRKTFKHGLDTYRLPKGSRLSDRLHAQRLRWDYWGKNSNKKSLFCCKTVILKALAKDTGRRFSSLGLRELFLLGGATAACGAWLGWKKEPLCQGTAVCKHSSGLGVEGGFN